MVVALLADQLPLRHAEHVGPGLADEADGKVVVNDHRRRGDGVYMPHQGLDGVVDPFYDPGIVAAELAGVTAGLELALHRSLGQHPSLGHQAIDRVNALVEVVLDLVKVTLVLVGDLFRDVALGDAVHVLGGHVQGADHRIQRVIETLHDLGKFTLELARIASCVELPFDGSFGEHPDLGCQLLELPLELL